MNCYSGMILSKYNLNIAWNVLNGAAQIELTWLLSVEKVNMAYEETEA